ncbi:MAG: hypothetical protein EOM12_10410 [Verrucomicrobiae bacterium]|nr:hypothetical protein [Verrucomicrobiae bacterium]
MHETLDTDALIGSNIEELLEFRRLYDRITPKCSVEQACEMLFRYFRFRYSEQILLKLYTKNNGLKVFSPYLAIGQMEFENMEEYQLLSFIEKLFAEFCERAGIPFTIKNERTVTEGIIKPSKAFIKANT